MQIVARLDLLTEGAVYLGTVRHVAPFGLFIELIKGQKDGLLLFEKTPYPEIARVLRVGQTVEVVATTVNVQQQAVYLQLMPDPTRYDGFWSHNATVRMDAAPDNGGR